MKIFKSGFTMAEVLAALLIVGVIAILVLPMLVKNMQKQQSVAILGRAVDQIQTGNQNIIQFANVNRTNGSYSNTLSSVNMSDLISGQGQTSILLDFEDVIPAYWGLVPFDGNLLPIKDFSGNEESTDAQRVDAGTRFSFSKFPGMVAISGNIANIDSINSADRITDIFVYIDTNGWDRRPNIAGKDVFAFQLRNDGTLRPAFGTDAGDYADQVLQSGYRINYY